jgi:urea transporter/murein DD-endopeptidase MepM/ murein hydrolase activator NlpD
LKNFSNSFLNSYADIFFIKDVYNGLGILLITFLNYNAGFSGVIAVLSAYFFARLLGLKSEFLSTGYYTYNALLVGLAIGFLFKLSFLSLPLIIIAGCLTLIITATSSKVFHNLFNLQALSIPFMVISTLVYLSVSSFTNLFVNALYAQHSVLHLDFLPFWLAGYLSSLGAIIFMPNEVTGLLIAMLLIFNSRILFLLSVAGFVLGVSLYALFVGSFENSINNISNFNYILIAMALGGIFNIPSLKSYNIAMVAVATSTLVASAGQVFWSQYGLPIFTLPFLLITLSFVYILNLLDFELRTKFYIGTPEQNLEHYCATQGRFITDQVAISLPFKDSWLAWQGFDGKWTHKGEYKYAYDFVKTDASGKTHLGGGTLLTDYYAYAQEVLSPVNGRVVRVISQLPDNTIGSTDIQNNWGNEIIIESDMGVVVKLAHFAYDSIFVYEGQTVIAGTVIGLCGNSGNSPQPHIHIQVQTSILPHAITKPFVFVNYAHLGEFNLHGEPKENTEIRHCQFDLFYDQVTNFVLDQVFNFNVYKDKELVDQMALKVTMSDFGIYYFETQHGKLYFGKEYGNFYFYNLEGNDPNLKMIYLALSTMPISNVPNLQWNDRIKNSLVLKPWQQFFANLVNAFSINKIQTQVNYFFDDHSHIKGNITNRFFGIELNTSVKLNPINGFDEIKINNYTLTNNESIN